MLRFLWSHFENRPRNNRDSRSFWSSQNIDTKSWSLYLAASFIYNPTRSQINYCWQYWSNFRMKNSIFNASFISESNIYVNQISRNFLVEKRLLELRYDAIIIFIIAHFLTQNVISSFAISPSLVIAYILTNELSRRILLSCHADTFSMTH
jgi:hypothetical protein